MLCVDGFQYTEPRISIISSGNLLIPHYRWTQTCLTEMLVICSHDRWPLQDTRDVQFVLRVAHFDKGRQFANL